MKMPSRGRLFAYTALLATVVAAFYLWRDFHLTASEIKLPDVVVENIELNRVVRGDKWKLTSPMVEHRDGKIYGSSVDVAVSKAGGGAAELFAASGVFSNDSDEISLKSVRGTMSDGPKNVFMQAGAAEYEPVKGMWFLKDGVVLSNDEIEVRGPEGYYDTKSGTASITGGGTAEWGL